MLFHRIAPGWQPTGDTACGDRAMTEKEPSPTAAIAQLQQEISYIRAVLRQLSREVNTIADALGLSDADLERP